MKAVFLIDSLTAGGAQRQFVELVKGLKNTFIEPEVVVYYNLPFFKGELDAIGITTHLFRKRDKLGLSFLCSFLPYLRRTKPAFLHSFLNTPNFYARCAKILMRGKLKVITSERSPAIAHFGRLCFLEKLTWRYSDRIIANARSIKSVLVNNVKIPDERVDVVFNGIPVERFRMADEKKVLEIRNNAHVNGKNNFLLGLVGRLREEKNHEMLLQAVSFVEKQRPGLNLKVGFWGAEINPVYASKVRQSILDLGLRDKVFMSPPVKDIASVYAACDVIVLPSLWEGFPNVVLEAMAAGRVVIASDIADNTSFINHGVNGFIIPGNSTESLAQRIIEVLSMNADARAQMGRRAQKEIEDNYTVNHMVQNTLAVYQRCGLFLP